MKSQLKKSSLPGTEEEFTINPRQYLPLIVQWWWLILLATLLAGGLGYLVSLQITPVFRASTTVLINEAPSNKTTDYNAILTSVRVATTYAQMMTKRPVIEAVISRLGINMPLEYVAEMIEVSPVRDTQLIVVNVESTDPGLAAAVANALVLEFSEQIQETQSTRYAASKNSLKAQVADMERQIDQTRKSVEETTDQTERDRLETRLNQYGQIYANLVVSYEQIRLAEAQTISNVVHVERAVSPTLPIRPKTIQTILISVMIGLVLSVTGIFIYDALDDTVRSPADISQKLNLVVIAMINRYDEPEDGRLITRAQPRSPTAEAFRSLRTNVQYASVDKPVRTLMVTSPAPGDGKTTITSNLAVVMAQSGREITIMDADLHRPRIHNIFGVELRPGLSNLFIRPSVHMNGSHQSTPVERLRIVTAGEIPQNPSELLGTKRMREILSTVLDKSDMVLIDTPPVLSVTDAVVLAPIIDAVLIVVRPGVTRMNALIAAVEQLRYVGANVIGVVLNDIDHHSSRYGYYYKNDYYKKYQYYQSYDSSPNKTNRRTFSDTHKVEDETSEMI